MATKKPRAASKKRRKPRMKRYPGPSDFEYLSVRPGTYTSIRHTYGGTPEHMIYYDPPIEFSGPVTTSFGQQVTTSFNTPGWPNVKQKPDNYFRRDKEFRSDPITPFEIRAWRRTDVEQYAQGLIHREDYFLGNVYMLGGKLNQGVSADSPYPGLTATLRNRLQLAKANTAVAMAELNKTAAFVSKTARRLARSYLALRHFKFRDFARELGLTEAVVPDLRRKHSLARSDKSRVGSFASEAWLEYSYAWKPLLKDVYDHADALAQTVVERSWVMREAKAKTKTHRKENIVTKLDNSCFDTEFTSNDELWGAMEVRYSISPGTVSAVRAFGLTNPLEVAWELLPFSFVVDWFLPIGDAIRGLTATEGLTFHSGWYTTRSLHTIESVIFANGREVISGAVRQVGSGRLEARRWWFSINRVQLLDFPPPPFPQWKDPRGLGHLNKPDLDGNYSSSKAVLLQDSAHGLSAIALLKTIFLDKRDVRRTVR